MINEYLTLQKIKEKQYFLKQNNVCKDIALDVTLTLNLEFVQEK